MDSVLKALADAQRPVLIVGAGARDAGDALIDFIDALHIPVAPTWAMLDAVGWHPLSIGSFGTHGNRAANFVVQNADFILSIGSRLDTKATGSPEATFAPKAIKFMVDADRSEIEKFNTLGVELHGIWMHVRSFLNGIQPRLKQLCLPAFQQWHAQVERWRIDYPITAGGPYEVVRRLSEDASSDAVICCDTGCTIAWVCQAWRFKRGQRLLHAWNQTPMGYALPAAVGAHYATGKPVLVLTGDGSLMMSIGELATIKGLPIHVVLFNNHGHAMCRQTQREWLGNRYNATSVAGGLKFPDFDAVLRAFNVEFTQLIMDNEWDVVPKAKFGHPNHDAHPLLDRETLRREMSVGGIEV